MLSGVVINIYSYWRCGHFSFFNEIYPCSICVVLRTYF